MRYDGPLQVRGARPGGHGKVRDEAPGVVESVGVGDSATIVPHGGGIVSRKVGSGARDEEDVEGGAFGAKRLEFGSEEGIVLRVVESCEGVLVVVDDGKEGAAFGGAGGFGEVESEVMERRIAEGREEGEDGIWAGAQSQGVKSRKGEFGRRRDG